MKIVMDGKEVKAEPGQTIIEVARANGVFIPTLCHNPALEPAAMCRLCTVEINEGRRSRMVTACNYPLRVDAEIVTDNDILRQGRKLIIELLYARCPDSEVLKALAERYGADLDRFPQQNVDCVMCGLCVRVCEKVGGFVLALSGRGVDIHVQTPFGHLSDQCIGCGSCARICPVHKIQLIDEPDGLRRIIVRGQEVSRVMMPTCAVCGKHFGPIIDLDEVLNRAGEAGVPPFNREICPECSRQRLARRLAERHFEQYQLASGEEA